MPAFENGMDRELGPFSEVVSLKPVFALESEIQLLIFTALDALWFNSDCVFYARRFCGKRKDLQQLIKAWNRKLKKMSQIFHSFHSFQFE